MFIGGDDSLKHAPHTSDSSSPPAAPRLPRPHPHRAQPVPRLEVQRIEGDMFISSFLCIRDVSPGPVTLEQLQEAAQSVPAPQNDEFGECLPWVLAVVLKLHDMGLVVLANAEAPQDKAYTRRDKCPNVAVSQFSH
ncbi:uncharacterized protein EDB91DRAFT_1350224 [Suillus paluster]|uniref:uncharacterized protein n=1 Tax=Suillus paluster TaxID=48578 RepID=UPI001B868803|nr:uncharacterized protein EDB91DRAFT_1350224 [Suillus paluster]KAG1727936.1 hypothetical protein EDB91DRAFT_1350224 [Suillus paluster]